MNTLKKLPCTLVTCLLLCTILFSCKKNSDSQGLPPDTNEFVNYSVDGVNYNYTAPADAVGMSNSPVMENQTFATPVYGVHSTGQVDANYSVITFDSLGIALNSNQRLHIFGTTNLFGANNPLLAQSPMNVHITEFGQPGEFIAGDFNGILFETMAQNQTHNISCSFRVRRTN